MTRRLAVLVWVLAISGLSLQAEGTTAAPQINADILTDTAGANLAPYLKQFLSDLRRHWTPLVAGAEAQSGVRKEVVLQVVIKPDGQIGSLRLVAPLRGDDWLRKAAWAATTNSPLQPLPVEMAGHELGLRLHFVTD